MAVEDVAQEDEMKPNNGSTGLDFLFLCDIVLNVG